MTNQKIEEYITKNSYYAMKKLIEGFFHCSKNQLDVENPQIHLEIQKNSMILLFRLLYLLIAEANNYLPFQNKLYLEQYSFHRLKHEIIDKKYVSLINTALWFKLKELFNIINKGSQSFGIEIYEFKIPPYFGQLFNPNRNLRLESWEISDFYLSNAIELISRNGDEKNQRKMFIDYSILDISFLERIYDYLLEYKIKIMKKERNNLKNKLNSQQINISGTKLNNRLYLAKTKEKRKSLGSFYTPKNIIKIIIKNTLKPAVKEKKIEAKNKNQKLFDALLSIKVLDNAMGCGSFLLQTVEYLSKTLYQALQEDIKSGKTTRTNYHTLNWIKEQIISHCIYGVDLDYIAVELSKMALWLTIENRNNSFDNLNNHIKQGNSLIGSFIDELDIPLSIIHETEKKFLKLNKLFNFPKLKLIADLSTSFFFRNNIQKEIYDKTISDLLFCSEEEFIKLKEKNFIKKTINISKENFFFHWELEFPEVFFGLNNIGKFKKGFDIIIGNPPWVSLRGKHSAEIFTDFEISYLENKFTKNTYMPNVYEYFILQSFRLLKKGGRHSYIVPDRLGFNESMEYLRNTIINNYSLNSLIYKVSFPNVIVDTLIYSITSIPPNNNHKILVKEHNYETIEIENDFYRNLTNTTFHFFKKREIFNLIKTIDQIDRIKLEEIVDTAGGFGGKSELITKYKISNYQIPVIKGMDVKRYAINYNRYFEFKKENITGRTTDKKKLGSVPKVLLRKTGIILNAAYDDTGIYPEQSLYFFFNFKKEYSPFYILSLLNSSLFKFYYIEKLVTNRETTPQLKKIHLYQFPIKKINFNTNKIERKNENNKLIDLYKKYLEKGLIGIFDNSLSINNYKIDIFHDFLTFLARFITDLKRKNNNKKDMGKKIDLTDKLIDYIVFKLYNLAPKNIKTIKENLIERGIK